MPMPEGSQLNQSISPFLTSLAMGFLPDFTEMIADRVFPTLSVAAPTGSFNIWTSGDFLRRGGKELANAEAPPVEGFAMSSGTYSTRRWGVSTNYTAMDLANARIAGTSEAQLREAKTLFVVGKGLIEREIQVAALCQTTANWSATYAGVTSGPSASQFVQWDQAASDPASDIRRMGRIAQLASGKKFNTMVIPPYVLDVLLKNTSIIAKVTPGYYGLGANKPVEVTLEQLKTVFGVDNILVPDAVYNSAKEGQTATNAFIWSNTVWLGHVTPRPSIQTPSAGYIMAWNGDTTAGLPVGVASGPGPANFGAVKNDKGLFIKTYDENRPNARFIDCELFDKPNVTAASLGITLTAPIA